MSDTSNTQQYVCPNCNYNNSWTRDEILQRGKEVIYRGDNEAVYSLRCKNPAGCDARMRVAIQRQKG